ncbi:hypothetical protein JCM18918_3219 [Cutibacterium acnes JCM 18918]|nr:hypothetical protein JCM18918_3219 [Cutibacterium acnes JCM 18918]
MALLGWDIAATNPPRRRGPDVEVKKKLTVFAEGYRYDSAQSPTSSAFAAARLRR